MRIKVTQPSHRMLFVMWLSAVLSFWGFRLVQDNQLTLETLSAGVITQTILVAFGLLLIHLAARFLPWVELKGKG